MSSTPLTAGKAPFPPPRVPDHELLRRIGRGAYGEVWLARSVTGAFRAVKIVHRSSFDHDRPFEREFEGILKFEPISRTHDSQVDILHVGRGEDSFYYVMELADDQATGGQIHPDNYTPRTLKSDLQFYGRLPFEECVRIGIALTTALENLHGHGLVHRDVKPSNIIFVNGVPKLADIGLVTGVDATRSYVGTEGFAAPEGSGTPQADLYSLGKVLYEAATGKDRQEFPELPTQLRELPDRDGLMELNAVIARACRHDPKDRYTSATAMRADLELLQSGKSLARLHRTEAQLRFVQRAGAIVTAIAAVIAAGWLWQARQTHQIRALATEKTQLLAREQTAHEEAKAAGRSALKERDRALIAERETRAVLAFIQTNIIAAARPQTELGGLGRDVTILHALHQADHQISGRFKDQPLVEAQLRLELGETYALLGDFQGAVAQYERAVTLRREVLGSEDVQTLDATADLAQALSWTGKKDECVRLLEQAVRSATSRLGPAEPPTLDFLTRLGLAYRDVESMPLAIATLEKAYDLSCASLGSDNPKTLRVLNHLAVTHHRAKNLPQAAALLEKLRDQRSRVLGLEDEETTCAMIDLARIYQEMGRWDDARPLFETALETRRRIQGADHYATLIAIDSLADAFRQARWFEPSQPLHEEALSVREKKLGPDHPETLTACRNLASLLLDWVWTERALATNSNPSMAAQSAARAHEAERLCRRCLTAESRLYQSDDPQLTETRTLLGASIAAIAATGGDLEISARLGRLKEAESVLLGACQDNPIAQGVNPIRSANNLFALVRLYETWEILEPGTGKRQQAASWQQEFQAWHAREGRDKPSPDEKALPQRAGAH